MTNLIGFLQTFNQLLTAGIAITAFSLLLYALSFNLRNRVARSFAVIMLCVVVVFVGEAIASVSDTPETMELWFKFQWTGLVFLPPAYLHFSDALLATTGKPSRGRRRLLVRLNYFISVGFLITLPFSLLVGPIITTGQPSPHLERTTLTWVFTAVYLIAMIWAWVNFQRAFRRTVTSASRRRMRYLITGALAPAFGAFPYLLFGSSFAGEHELTFWLVADLINILVSILLVLMAYAVAFFGVPWPDRIVKRRLFKWVMRGPVTASTVLTTTTLVRRAGQAFGEIYSAAVPITMVGTLLLMQYMVTLLAPIWERWLFYGGDRDNLQLLQTLEERLLTTDDLRQFLESVLTAVCDLLQVDTGFIVALEPPGTEFVVNIGDDNKLEQVELPTTLLQVVSENDIAGETVGEPLRLFTWDDYWVVPMFERENGNGTLLGLLGAAINPEEPLDDEQRESLSALVNRATIALEDRSTQQKVFISLESLNLEVGMIQQLRAAAGYDGSIILAEPDALLVLDQNPDINKWVKDALSHYWGGPKLSESPLLRLQVVQQALGKHNGVSVNALRSILKEGIRRVRPEGERRFTAEWILFNILEMKFMEGRKVREIALRLAMSEADLYRKQRVAIEAVAKAIVDMEYKAREEKTT
jgi:hypothetical protein